MCWWGAHLRLWPVGRLPLFLLICGLTSNRAKVLEFDMENFPTRDPDGVAKPSVVFFFAPWCAHSKIIFPLFSKTVKVCGDCVCACM